MQFDRPQGGPRFGSIVAGEGITFAAWSGAAARMWVCIFDTNGENEIARHELKRGEGDVWSVSVPGLGEGTRYGFRADGDYDPKRGLWFDPNKLLMDPYAVEIDRAYVYDSRLCAHHRKPVDTAPLMPKAVARAPIASGPPGPPLFQPGGLIYELQIRAFSMRHPAVPEKQRGTLAALAHPAIVEHLKRLGVSAVELMPVTAWIDERHLQPLGLTNAWGYNPVSFMALDPRLVPGGMKELRETVATLRDAGIGVILDLVFNHTGESDEHGPTLSLRGLDNRAYYRHAGRTGRLVNDTGTGNTVACAHPIVRELILDSLRHFVRLGVDGFRFDLAPVLGREGGDFNPNAALLNEIRADPLLGDRVLIAEPWDIGHSGYQLGNFPPPFLEWNDRYRDDVRRFWRGDHDMIGRLATRLAGSSDVFERAGNAASRSVSFIAAHDGMTLADICAFERKHNEANGEKNRDGHGENLSWNNGAEGATADPKILLSRVRDARALLATLFFSRGTVMLTAGDEFGRTQHGNNNAYAQDNALTWLDWAGRDTELESYAVRLAALRREIAAFRDTAFLTGAPPSAGGQPDVRWLTETGEALVASDWEDARRHRLSMVLGAGVNGGAAAILFNGDRRGTTFVLPRQDGFVWERVLPENGSAGSRSAFLVPGRSVHVAIERPQNGERSA